ncbi:DNA cytosine methyltransferase [Candidatus Tisiphia endosymbiont of Myopa tessellatipennis]|uniref:DNA cytosine methyltransferase n=1 Tax=Candidatus Tisiphia endosymbiont of Myopa tessellatipennis TaxID=3066257 RepID=UPI00313A916C
MGYAITLSAFGGRVGARTGLYLINNRIRQLSVNECKNLMGFPKNHHVIEGIKGYQQLGNAVIPKMISNIYDSIGIS